MIAGTGIDLVEVGRIIQELEKHGKSFVKKIFTKAEIEYCEQKTNIAIRAQHYAGRFAAKEAFFKAIGTGWRGGIHWNDVEVINDQLGKPGLNLNGKAVEIIEKMEVNSIHISISHTKNTAIAIVILEN
ncbi:MAG: holo-ACP synthase [Candidatus Cloacimonadota bacterium]|nr:holo-ACP synthase [Candidatus Cloacimonadota bacterium]